MVIFYNYYDIEQTIWKEDTVVKKILRSAALFSVLTASVLVIPNISIASEKGTFEKVDVNSGIFDMILQSLEIAKKEKPDANEDEI